MCKKWNSSLKQGILGESRKWLTCYQYLRKKSIESIAACAPLFLDPLPSSPPHRHQIWLWERRLWCLHCHGVQIRPKDQEDPVSFALAQALLKRMQNLHFLSLCPLSSLQVSIALTWPLDLLSCDLPCSRSFLWTFFPSGCICPGFQSLRATVSCCTDIYFAFEQISDWGPGKNGFTHKEVMHCPGRRFRSTYIRRVIPLKGWVRTPIILCDWANVTLT